MLKITQDILDSNKEQMTGLVINGPSFGQQDLHILSQLKGQILALEQVLKTKEYLEELVTNEEDNEPKSDRSTNISKS